MGLIILLYTEQIVESDTMLKKKQQSFMNWTAEDRWNFCLTAQKYLLTESLWKFRFASSESILSDNKLLLIPAYIRFPRLSKITHLDDKREVNHTIQCSGWPEVYIKLEKLEEGELVIILKKNELQKMTHL